MAIQDLQVIKRSGVIETFNLDKIITAITKAAEHTFKPISANELASVIDYIYDKLAIYDDENSYEIPVDEIHDIVINALFEVRDDVAKRYVSYHEFQNSQNKVFDSLKDLIDISSSVDLPVNQNKLIVERTTAKELAMRYSLRPDWQKAITDGIIEIPNIETLWYKTQEVGYIDFAKKFTNLAKGELADATLDFGEMVDDLKRLILASYNNYTSALVIHLRTILANYIKLSYYRNVALASQIINRSLDYSGSTKQLSEEMAYELVFQEVMNSVYQIVDIRQFCKDNHNIDLVFAASSLFPEITDNEAVNTKLHELFQSVLSILGIMPDLRVTGFKALSMKLNVKTLTDTQLISKYAYMASDIIAYYVKNAGVNQSEITLQLDVPSGSPEYKSIETVMSETDLGNNTLYIYND